MKPTPPQPGWIERLYRRGVGIAIPVTIIAGLVLLLSAGNRQGPAAPVAAKAAAQVVLMAEPLQEKAPSVLLKPPPERPCPADSAGHTAGACRRHTQPSSH
ncbi:MAG: hypothetical protein WCH32_07460 [Pseudomonadota bacterium]|nr:hypothetical protein [Pseudomonadota bacterium]